VRKHEETGVWWASPHAASVVALVPTVLSIFVMVHELTLHNSLGGVTFAWAGHNFASAVSLSNGNLPYNNFTTSFPLNQPPGMTIILLPFAFGAHGGDAGGAMAAARIFTVIVSVFNVFLVGFSARRHGIASSFVAGTLFALFPYAFYSTASYTFEPFLVLFCLLSFQAAFSQGFMVHGGRLIAAGALMGVAMTFKPWAVIPAIALLVCAAINWRESLGRVAGGLAIGLFVPNIFFFLASPSAYISDVIGAELNTGTGAGSNPGGGRLQEVLGLGRPLGLTSTSTLALVIALVIAVLVVVTSIGRITGSTWHDWVVLGTTAGIAAIAFVPSSLPIGYTYFLAAFGAILLGHTVGKLVSMLSTISIGTSDTTSTLAGGLTILIVGGMIGTIGICAPKEANFERAYFFKHGTNPGAFLMKAIPKNACVISNNPEALVISGHYGTTPSNCPIFPDPAAILAAAGSGATIASPAVVNNWERAFSGSQYFVEYPGPDNIPWSFELKDFFSRNFLPYDEAHGIKIFVNRTPRALEAP
jgi:hypothetical protein